MASLAPFLICFKAAHWATKSVISEASSSVASGWALYDGSWDICRYLPLFVDCCNKYYSLIIDLH